MSEIRRINENTWRFEDNGVRFFLLTGEKEALLIDSGMQCPDAKALAQAVTKLPIRLLNTHADPDHISGNASFEHVYMHPAEPYAMPEKVTPVSNGTRLDLGGRVLEIVELPGHTPGSIAVLDVQNRVLYGGDAIQDGRIFMFGQKRDLPLYIKSLRALWKKRRDDFDTVYPSHGTFPVQPELIPQLFDAAEQILCREADGRDVEWMGQTILYYDFGFAGFLCDRKG